MQALAAEALLRFEPGSDARPQAHFIWKRELLFAHKPFLEKGLSQSTNARPSYTITPHSLKDGFVKLA